MLGLVASLTAIEAAAQTVPAARPTVCDPPGTEPVLVRDIDESGDIVLTDGRSVAPPGLDLGLDTLAGAERAAHLAALRAALAGRAFLAKPHPIARDRWRRARLLAFERQGGASGRSLHAALLAEGLARLVPGDGIDACLPALLPHEAAARERRAGLWAADRLPLLSAREPEAIKRRAGQFGIVEGKVLTVGERPQRTYLNFGRSWRRDFSVTIAKRSLGILKAAGISPSSFGEKQIRVRGIITGRRAPFIEVTSAAQIEVVGRGDQ